MNNFIYYTPTKVFFGKKEEEKVGSIIFEYGYKKVLKEYEEFFNSFNRNALHAFTLKFIHPITLKEMSFTAEMPQELIDLEEILAKSVL